MIRLPRFHRAVRDAALPLVVVLATGCYNYVPVTTQPPVGSDVRATLTDAEALRLSERTGDLTRSFEGRLMAASDDSLSISVITARASSEFTGSQTLRQTLQIPRSGVTELAGRELSLSKTAVLGVLMGGVIALAVNSVVETGGNTPDDGNGGEPTGTFVPIFRMIIGR